MTTFVSWHTNLRQAHDHLKRLRHHPLKEVSEIANEILENLKTKYSASFLHKSYQSEEDYLAKCSALTYSDHTR